MNSEDQRRRRRFDLRLPFELVREGTLPRDEAGETQNLSSVGVLFSSNVELEVGSPIEYFITLQQGNNGGGSIRLHCVGKVVRRHDAGGSVPSEDVISMAATLERYEFIRQDES